MLAVIQYASVASWAKSWYVPAGPGQLTGHLHGGGIVASIGLLVLFVIINLVGIRWLANVNSVVTTWKVIVPIVAILVLLVTHFHSSNFTGGGGFFAKTNGVSNLKDAWKYIFEALPGAGIIFSLLGFEQAVQLGGESKRGPRDLPRAVIYSILLGAGIYILAQVAFIAALDPTVIAHTTWAVSYTHLDVYKRQGYEKEAVEIRVRLLRCRESQAQRLDGGRDDRRPRNGRAGGRRDWVAREPPPSHRLGKGASEQRLLKPRSSNG